MAGGGIQVTMGYLGKLILIGMFLEVRNAVGLLLVHYVENYLPFCVIFHGLGTVPPLIGPFVL